MFSVLAAATRWNPRLQTLDGRLSKYIKGNPIRVDGSPRASGILDTVSTRKALASQFSIISRVSRFVQPQRTESRSLMTFGIPK